MHSINLKVPWPFYSVSSQATLASKERKSYINSITNRSVPSLTGAWVTAAVISAAAALAFNVLHIDPGTTKLEFMLIICTHTDEY